MKMHFW